MLLIVVSSNSLFSNDFIYTYPIKYSNATDVLVKVAIELENVSAVVNGKSYQLNEMGSFLLEDIQDSAAKYYAVVL